MDRRPLATPSQLAEYLGIPEATLSQWRARGKGPKWTRVGRHVRYRWSEVDAWLDTQSSDRGAA
ncbi:DNA binding domain-containing protein, excisionase family [Amycolatopsis tolypomycina]|uniref:DNA binding domain-containing protein, excisionase family n=1 Tax=Amycolatopsis tolypomycina TaxID=208445 RepID=A0A1H4WP83_9PSEU|nr:helix-turn-helix domain-containing protein [Amycolatopsis tolypomycina]SEC95136.1 DNA binding domain-containing protein, excisionase family [Amycolatopsis tolypomycina]